MTFKEKSKHYYVLGQGAIAFSAINFEVDGNMTENGKEIIHAFINFPEDFDFARKYVGGYTNDHINEFGQRKVFKIYDFGPYPIDLLEMEDYKKISVEEFEELATEMLSDYDIPEREIKYYEFIGKVKNDFEEVKTNSHEFYQLLPADWKYNDLSPFHLSSYLCGFSINRMDKILTVLQIDDD
ncbi:hypothetical protein [Flavobacterium humi]|uniref:Uncharacterized protein n=1 Tax=Flavobacterium humi TaxID=2562683 RepID=A0A4Z0L6F6_9FLAO|nr:hypothetical protein [Flavobacterium humi]TGD57305.1 hypothetical protein E4635_11835 [Flavobacterium humi]